jgi:hypothetical protein
VDLVFTKLFWLQFGAGFLPFFLAGVSGGLWRVVRWLLYLGAAMLAASFIYFYTPLGILNALVEIWESVRIIGLPGLAGAVSGILMAPTAVALLRRKRAQYG